MHCPRCGHQARPEDRFCVECGQRLDRGRTAADPDPRGLQGSERGPEPERSEQGLATRLKGIPRSAIGSTRSFARRVIGSTRRERLVTAGTVGALAIAVIAFLSLPTEEDPQGSGEDLDPYILEADRICTEAKLQTEDAAKRSSEVKQVGVNSIVTYSRLLRPIAARTAKRMAALRPPPRYRVAAAELNSAFATLARRANATKGKDGDAALAAFGGLVQAGSRVETAIAKLGLPECAGREITARG